MIENIQNASPAEIDAELNELGYQRAVAQARVADHSKLLKSRTRRGDQPSELAAYQRRIDEQRAIVDDLDAKMAPLEAEYDRRGGWARAFLVTNSGGHVHKDMSCGTCFITTSYAWMTDFSGMDEAEIVDAAGERACTVCYPSAPVEVLSKPTRMFTKDEVAAQAARAERDAKRVVAQAAKVLDPETGEELFKTEKAATNAISGALMDMRRYDFTHPDNDKWEASAVRAIAALAARTGADPAEMRAEFEARADKRFAAETRKNWRELKADCAAGRWTRAMINFDSATVRYGRSIGEELVFPGE
jgi:hypothetical protein